MTEFPASAPGVTTQQPAGANGIDYGLVLNIVNASKRPYEAMKAFVEQEREAARQEALAPVLALADGWDVTSRMTPDVRALLTDLRAVVERAVEPTP